MREDFLRWHMSHLVSFGSRVYASALKVVPSHEIIEVFSEGSKVTRDKKYQPEVAVNLPRRSK
jgi:hypothetical protein